MDYPNSANAVRDFFGDGNIRPIVDLPNRLANLEAALLPGHRYSVDEFIDGYTHFPLYSPFLPPQRALAVRNSMSDAGENRIYDQVGLTADRLPQPASLKLCPECAANDLKSYGEMYWHRVHQVYGVKVCPLHQKFLVETNVRWNQHSPVSAQSTSRFAFNRAAPHIDAALHHHKILLSVAQYTEWLLNWRGAPLGKDEVRRRYHNLLLRQGLAYYNGNVRTAELIDRFVAFFTPKLLTEFRCEIKSVRSNWVLRLLHPCKTEIAQHPLRHILLIIFLGIAIDRFFENFEEFKPFGTGPWPCLNPTADHCNHTVITGVRIQEGIKGKPGVPRGIFSCACGFIYTRYGPDERDEDRFRYDSVMEYGKTWEEHFIKRWNDPEVTLSSLSTELGVYQFTLTRHAIRLGLPLERQNKYARPTSQERIREYSNPRKTLSQASVTRKAEWLDLRKKHPRAGRQALRKLAPYLYDWLQEHAPTWHEANLPASKVTPSIPTSKDWEIEDAPLAEAIEAVAKRIRGIPGKPVRVSISLLAKEVGHRSWLERYLNNLPKTAVALAEHLESVEDFLIRRIKWATEYYLDQKKLPSRSQLSAYAGVRGRTAGKTAKVQESLSEAMTLLSKNISSQE
jgi:hypothetical protein